VRLKTYYVEELQALVHVVQTVEDYKQVYNALERDGMASVDTETTGLDIYTPDFRVRLVQYGDTNEAYVWAFDDHPALTKAATTTRHVWYHNAAFDCLSLDRAGGPTLEQTTPFALDTGVLARLMDPRPKEHGGIGHELKELAAYHMKLDVADSRDVVIAEGHRLGIKKDDVWRDIPIDNEVYVKYAGSDTILTARLASLLRNDVKTVGLDEWATKEHQLAVMLMYVQRRGWACDREYAKVAKSNFDKAFESSEADLAAFGITPTATGNYYSSKKSIIEKFTELGVKFTHFTAKSKAPSLDEEALTDIAARYNDNDDIERLANTILIASQNQKNSHTFMHGILHYSEYDGRVHASINPTGARTGRMSSSRPNSQNYPRKYAEIRGSYIADEGETLISVDFSGVEWRVAAAVTRDERMQADFRNGEDIHLNVARKVYGDWVMKHDEERQTAKIIGLGRLYGGGVKTLVKQTGAPEHRVQAAVEALDELYPGIAALRKRFYDVIDGPTVLKTPTGKRVIADSAHLGLNYSIQGPARDLLAEAIIRLWSEGYGPNIRGVIHDEVVLSVPGDAEQHVKRVKNIMECDFMGVRIEADGNVLGKRWRKA
jgi:DNA polymerase-1